MYTDRLVELRPTLIDSPYSSVPVEDWTNPVLVPLDAPVTVQPLTSTEEHDGLGTTVTLEGWRVISAPGHLLDALDAGARVRVEGRAGDFDVDGEPQHWHGVLPHTELRLKRHGGAGI